MDGTVIILGCGSSAGVPAIGNWWGACDPAHPRNQRTRPSIALQTEQTLIIVDTGPDFREQMNREKLRCPDHVLITHEHSDHVNGIDELRTLQRLNKKMFPTYSSPECLTKLQHRFDYMFVSSEDGFYPAVCTPMTLSMGQKMVIGDIPLIPFYQNHGTIQSVGLRIGNIAYSTDVKRLDDAAFDVLKGVETWIVDGAGHNSRTNPVHACIDEVVEMNKRVGASRVILTHMPPTMDYQTLVDTLPEGFVPAYDGLTLRFNVL
jgi:phosphoribosyl 1,2-cyclic phosphate phosphodiesterase